MPRYSEEIVNEIIELRKKPEWLISQICQKVGIAESTYYEWRNSKLEFLEKLKKSEQERFCNIGIKAETALLKKIDGYNYEEVTTVVIPDENGNPMVKSKTTVKKHVPPSDTAIIFALKNTKENEYKDRVVQSHEGSIEFRKRLLDD